MLLRKRLRLDKLRFDKVRFTKRRVIVTAAVVVVVGGGVGAWAATRPAATPATGVATAATTTLRQALTSSGTIEPAQQDNLNFAVSGQVTAVNVSAGAQVTAGQALATVNSAALSATVAEAQASLSSDQARLSTDSGNGASSTQVAADQAAVTAAQNQVTNAQNALAEATLTSPITGTVASVNLTVGQQVSGSSGSTGSSAGSGSTGGTGGAGAGGAGGTSGAGTGSTGTGTGTGSSTDQIVVISNGSYVVNASVDDTQVGQVKVGDQAVITPNSGTTTAFGTVTSVALLASSSSSVPSYPVTIGVTGSPTGLYPGASASVQIIVKQLTNALVIPASALHFTNGKVTVLKLVSGKQTSVTVTTGMTQGGQIQILSGLADGDQVVTPGTTRTAGAGGAGAGTGRTGAGGGFGGAGGFGGGGGFGGAGGLGGGGGGGAAPPVRVGG